MQTIYCYEENDGHVDVYSLDLGSCKLTYLDELTPPEGVESQVAFESWLQRRK